MKTKIIFYIIIFTFLNIHNSFCAEIHLEGMDESGCYNINGTNMCVSIIIVGNIEKGDSLKLKEAIEVTTPTYFKEKLNKKARVGRVYFDSQGGNLFEALEIGKMIREKTITTFVTHDSFCYSACVIAFLGGVERIPVGKVGIHSFYSENFYDVSSFKEADAEYNKVSTTLENYLKQIRVPTSLLDEMKKIPHYNLKILNFEELKSFGVIGIDPVFAQFKEKYILK